MKDLQSLTKTTKLGLLWVRSSTGYVPFYCVGCFVVFAPVRRVVQVRPTDLDRGIFLEKFRDWRGAERVCTEFIALFLDIDTRCVHTSIPKGN